MRDAVAIYDEQASRLAARYEQMSSSEALPGICELLRPNEGSLLALDVGAGSGRDAAWLASMGYEVVAAEPSAGMRGEAQRLHPEAQIRWIDDRLPSLTKVHQLGLAFDVIMLSAVWQHIAPVDRPRAFRKLVTLLKPGGILAVTLRHGPAPLDRPMHEVTLGEVEALARASGVEVFRVSRQDDSQARDEVQWTSVALRMPDDGAGALPLIRGIVLADEKSSTYKLALLRSIALIAELAPAAAAPVADEFDAVDIPLGLVALYWVRMYLPLVRAGLPQAPKNHGPDGLGFAKSGFRALLADRTPAQDLRVGAEFAMERGANVRAAIDEAARTIASMPANFIRFPNSEKRVFEVSRSRGMRAQLGLELSLNVLSGWGTLRVPGHIWRALSRLGVWVEPVLVTEWSRLIRAYATRMGQLASLDTIERQLAWEEPIRSTLLGKQATERLISSGSTIECVWSGIPLPRSQLDIDHCFPWSAWPCGDLWNLVPSHRRVNQHQKRDRLPAAETLSGARERIVRWWSDAWLGTAQLKDRFGREVAVALPVDDPSDLDQVFAGLEWRRLRLRQEQQLPEWNGPGFAGASLPS